MVSPCITFEKPLIDLENKIDELRRLSIAQVANLDDEIKELEQKAAKLSKKIFSNLRPYEIVQLSRHPKRPNTQEMITLVCSNFIELHGDRDLLDDRAIVGGIGKIDDYSVVIMGHQKGRTTKEKILRNFGMPRPEGYRKALRLMSMAERFSLPIVTFVDTPGAYPGIGAEERGQAEAIAKNIMVMSQLKTPIITVVIGEGGSGGALALAVANRIHMLRYAVYSVISPEGCSAILLKNADKAEQAANALKLTSEDALKFGIIDHIIPEPDGGAHRAAEFVAQQVKTQLLLDLQELSKFSPDELREKRIEKYMNIGAYIDS